MTKIDVAARELFTRLVTPGEGSGRHSSSRPSVGAAWPFPSAPKPWSACINGFGTQRLLTFDRDPATREPTVEVGHEALLTEWPRLKAWVDEDREGLRVMRRVAEAGEAWVQGGREEADLLRGCAARNRFGVDHSEPRSASRPTSETSSPRSIAATRCRQSQGSAHHSTTPLARRRESVWPSSSRSSRARSRSRNATKRRTNETGRNRRARSPRARCEASHAEARTATLGRMAFQAGSLAASNPSEALLLALEADRLLPNDDTLGSLEVALLANPTLLRSVSTTPLLNLFFTPDGTRVSGGTSDGRIVEIDTSTGATVREWKVGDGPVCGGLRRLGSGLAIRPNSPQVLARDEHGGVRRPGERRHRESVLRRRCPHRRTCKASGRLPSRPRPGYGSSTPQADRCSERSMARLRRCSRSAATARGWRSRAASGNIAVVDVATRRPVAPPVTLGSSRDHRVEQGRDAARRREPATTLASSTSPRARRSAHRSQPAAT